jgi:hypothetical protein
MAPGSVAMLKRTNGRPVDRELFERVLRREVFLSL